MLWAQVSSTWMPLAVALVKLDYGSGDIVGSRSHFWTGESIELEVLLILPYEYSYGLSFWEKPNLTYALKVDDALKQGGEFKMDLFIFLKFLALMVSKFMNLVLLKNQQDEISHGFDAVKDNLKVRLRALCLWCRAIQIRDSSSPSSCLQVCSSSFTLPIVGFSLNIASGCSYLLPQHFVRFLLS
ncbi:hypothetical protein K1719_038058 [Acacia pycnantha]|nr:hypothetical protein K1719_038058 [Acacia pycnantha]